MKMSMEHWWNESDGETEGMAEKPVPVLLCTPQVSCGLTWDQTNASMLKDLQFTS
jgi:hypothetical protein